MSSSNWLTLHFDVLCVEQGAILGLGLCVGSSIPTLVLQASMVQASWQQGASWVGGALLQYVAGGLLVGQLYFQPECVPTEPDCK